ncbi:putative quinol monooxygenase [Streptomyces sp. NPDC055105]|uniref:putative quinol monooxygenase n=1 Tax=Streptomyces sp. NPDC055105 TaxID=3365719 RepID=UPI0037D0DA48
MTRIAKYVQMTVKPEFEAELLEQLGQIRAAAAKEAGTEIWILHSVRDQPRTYTMYEIYSDAEATEAHEQLPELVALLPRLPGMLENDFTLVVLDEMQ